MKHLPSIFTGGFEDSLHTVYCGSAEKPVPYFSAANIESMLGVKNPYGSATSRVNTVIARIEEFLEAHPDTPHMEPHTPITLVGSTKPTEVVSDDGTYTILGVKSSKRATARQSYYYNEAALFFVLNTAKTAVANDIQHWINGEILPTIRRTGSFNLSRVMGIRTRGFLTDSVKRGIEEKRMTDSAYAELTDVVYFIRFGVHSDTLRRILRIDESENIREHLGQEDLDVLCELEAKVAACVDLGLSFRDIITNPRLQDLYRKKP